MQVYRWRFPGARFLALEAEGQPEWDSRRA